MAKEITDGKFSFTPTDGCAECEIIKEKLQTRGTLIFLALKCEMCGAASTNWNEPGYIDNPEERE